MFICTPRQYEEIRSYELRVEKAKQGAESNTVAASAKTHLGGGRAETAEMSCCPQFPSSIHLHRPAAAAL